MSKNIIQIARFTLVFIGLILGALPVFAQDIKVVNDGLRIVIQEVPVRIDGTLENKTGGQIDLLQNANSKITLRDSLINDSFFNVNGNGELIFEGSNKQAIIGSVIPEFYKLTLNNAAVTEDTLYLSQDLYITNELLFTDGNLHLKGKTITLRSDANVSGEANSKRVFDDGFGGIEIERGIDGFSGNIGGLGLSIEKIDGFGNTTVRREHTQQQGATDGSIYRFFKVIPSSDGGITKLTVNYLDAELGALNEANLGIFTSPNSGIVWQNQGGNLNTVTNVVDVTQAIDFNATTFVTLSEINCVTVPTITFPTNPIYVCQGETVTLDAGNPGNLYEWSTSETTQTIEVDETAFTNINGVINYTITVTTANGCIGSGNVDVILKAKPVANFTSNFACIGGPTQFTNTSTIAAGTITYNWDFGDPSVTTDVSTDTNPIYSYTNPGIYTATLTVTSDFGCEAIITKQVDVFDLPTADFSFNKVCLNETVSFVDMSSSPATTVISPYLWDFGDGNTATVSNPTYQFTTSGSHNVSLTITTNQNCSQTISKSVEIYPRPIPDFNNTVLCNSNEIKFDNLSTIATGTMTYAWDFGDGETSIAQNPNKTYLAAGSYTVLLEVSSAFICIESISKTITILMPPPILGDDIITCGSSFMVDANSNGLFGGSSYLWSDGSTSQTLTVTANGTYDVTISRGDGCIFYDAVRITLNSNPVIDLGTAVTACESQVLDPGYFGSGSVYVWSTGETTQKITVLNTGTYSVTITDQNNCQTSESVDVAILPLPVVNLGTDIVICNDQVLTLDAGNAGSTYLWSDGSTSKTLNVSSSGTYFVNVTNSNGCVGKGSIKVTVDTPYMVDLGDDIVLCNLDNVVLDAGVAADVYLWGSEAGFTSANRVVKITQPGKYWVTATSNFGCLDRDTVNIILDENPITAKFTVATLADVGDTLRFINLSFPNLKNSFWNFDDGVTSLEEDPSHIYFIPGDFDIRLIADNGICKDTVSTTITIRPLREDNVESDEPVLFVEILTLKAFPNPMSGELNIEVELNKEATIEVQFFTIQGYLVAQDQMYTKTYNQKFDFSQLSPGMYFVKLIVGQQTKVLRLVKK